MIQTSTNEISLNPEKCWNSVYTVVGNTALHLACRDYFNHLAAMKKKNENCFTSENVDAESIISSRRRPEPSW
ncbi:hypothetical protein ACFU93_15050 [Streptomyces sp. NPDC057611]|uniref:hypothetical protein n=1 Tax=Streptomyces sp. NPDC057611 TaxID=3346182 RepID=UPI0036A42DD0